MGNHGLQNMKLVKSKSLQLNGSIYLAGIFMAIAPGFFWANELQNENTPLGNDDTEFVFAGKCHNGENYRIFSYVKIIDGQAASFYDFEGPVGKGTIRSSTTPRTLSVRVCRQLAEVIDDY